MDSLLQLDQRAFSFINNQLQNPLFNAVMPYLRDKNFWIPLYVLLLVYFVLRFRKLAWIPILFAVLTVVVTDQLSSSVIKPWVHRLRPCNDPSFSDQVHLLVSCGGGFSFVSSHAANHFGFACFLIVLLQQRFRWMLPVALAWAAIVSFAQIYVGLHYPADVLCGAALGTAVGILTGNICKFILAKQNPPSLV